MEVGDIVTYIGIIKTTEYTIRNMFRHLTNNKQYEILGIRKKPDENWYYMIEHDDSYTLWFPIENFVEVKSKKMMANKYGLK